MEQFLTRLLELDQNIQYTTEMIEYYQEVYQPIAKLVPVEALVSDIFNHVNIPRPANFTVDPKYYNILLPEFYDNLHYVIYNGPPQTLHADYTKPVKTESDIVRAILKCGSRLYDYIINPSLEVMVAYCHDYSFHLDRICNPSRELVARCMANDDYLYTKHKTLFPDPVEACAINPKIIRYIDNPTDSLKFQMVKQDICNLKYIKNQSYELCEFVAQTLHDNSKKYFQTVSRNNPWAGSSLLQGIAYITKFTGVDYSSLAQIHTKEYPLKLENFQLFNDRIIDLLIEVPNFVSSLSDIPEIYLTSERIKILLKFNPHVLKTYPDEDIIGQDGYMIAFNSDNQIFEYIPKEYQTTEMVRTITELHPELLSQNVYSQKRFVDNRTRKLWKQALKNEIPMTQELCSAIFNLDSNEFQYIPVDYQTEEMIYYIKEHNHRMIPYIGREVDYVAIVNKYPNAIRYVPEKFQTLDMCKHAVKG